MGMKVGPNKVYLNCTWCGEQWGTPYPGTPVCPKCKKAKLCTNCFGYITPSGMGAHQRSSYCIYRGNITRLYEAGMDRAPRWLSFHERSLKNLAVHSETDRIEYGKNKGELRTEVWVPQWVANLQMPSDWNALAWLGRGLILSELLTALQEQPDLRPIYGVAAVMKLPLADALAMVLESKV